MSDIYCAFPNVDRSLIEVSELNELLDFVIRKDLEKIEKLNVEISNFVSHFIQVFRFYFDEDGFTVDLNIFSNHKLRKIEQLSNEMNSFLDFYNPSIDKSVLKEKIGFFVKHFKENFSIYDSGIVGRNKSFLKDDLLRINVELKNLVKNFYKLLLLDTFDYEESSSVYTLDENEIEVRRKVDRAIGVNYRYLTEKNLDRWWIVRERLVLNNERGKECEKNRKRKMEEDAEEREAKLVCKRSENEEKLNFKLSGKKIDYEYLETNRKRKLDVLQKENEEKLNFKLSGKRIEYEFFDASKKRKFEWVQKENEEKQNVRRRKIDDHIIEKEAISKIKIMAVEKENERKRKENREKEEDCRVKRARKENEDFERIMRNEKIRRKIRKRREKLARKLRMKKEKEGVARRMRKEKEDVERRMRREKENEERKMRIANLN